MTLRTPVEIGLAIRERRRALGLDQRTLAARVGVSRQWIVAVEQGRDRAPLGLVLRTLDALGLKLHIGEERARVSREPAAFGAIDINAWIDAHKGRAKR